MKKKLEIIQWGAEPAPYKYLPANCNNYCATTEVSFQLPDSFRGNIESPAIGIPSSTKVRQ